MASNGSSWNWAWFGLYSSWILTKCFEAFCRFFKCTSSFSSWIEEFWIFLFNNLITVSCSFTVRTHGFQVNFHPFSLRNHKKSLHWLINVQLFLFNWQNYSTIYACISRLLLHFQTKRKKNNLHCIFCWYCWLKMLGSVLINPTDLNWSWGTEQNGHSHPHSIVKKTLTLETDNSPDLKTDLRRRICLSQFFTLNP